MASRNLQRRVIATRPVEQNNQWCEQLESYGFATLQLPLLAITPVALPAQQQAIKQHILDFDLYDAVIFVSQNAVQHAHHWVDQYWPQFPQGVRYFAVGRKTAQQVEHYFGPNPALNSAASVAMNSEELLQHPLLQKIAQQKILICRGLGGRGLLAEVLSGRGAKVDYCELYERQLPPSASEQLADVTLSSADVLSVFSGETLTNLLQAAQQTGDVNKVSQLNALPILVPGQRVAEQAQAAGFQHVFISPNASEPAMLATLLHEFSERHS